MVYTIVALPQDDQLHKLNTIRNYFYQNGFRQRVSKCKENAHITLLQLKDSLSKNFWSEVESSLINTRKINLTNFQIILQEHDRIKKIQNEIKDILNDADDSHFSFQRIKT